MEQKVIYITAKFTLTRFGNRRTLTRITDPQRIEAQNGVVELSPDEYRDFPEN